MGYQNLSGPVIRLRRLSDNELLALVRRLTRLFAQREGSEKLPLTDSEIEQFMNRALSKAGAEELITPREIIRDFLTLLNILKDNPSARFEELINRVTFTKGEADDGVIADEPKKDAAVLKTPPKKIGIFDIDI